MPKNDAKSVAPTPRVYGAGHKLIGKDYVTADLYAKVTGQAKYAEDFHAEGMLFCKLLLSPLPHARVRRLELRQALAMPGVKAILTADELPPPADTLTDNGTVIRANPKSERALTGARQQGGAFEKRCDFLLVLQYYILQENQAWMISHLQSLRALHN